MPKPSIKVADGNGRVIPPTSSSALYVVADENEAEGIRFVELPDYFSAYDASGGIDVSSGWTDITWDTELKKHTIFSHTADSAVITINKTAEFLFCFDYGCEMSSSSGNVPSNSAGRLVVDTGGGYNEVAGTMCYAYHDRTLQGTASASMSGIFVNVTSGDSFKVQVQRFAGNDTIVTLANSCRILIKSIDE